jgi:hypothetical protein
MQDSEASGVPTKATRFARQDHNLIKRAVN